MTDPPPIPDFLIRTAGDTKAPRAFSDEVTERRRTKSIVRCCSKLLQKHRKRRARKRRRAQSKGQSHGPDNRV